MLRSIALALAVLALPSLAVAEKWSFDPTHSFAYFKVRHMMVTDVRGQMSNVSGSVDFDPKNPSTLKVDARIDSSTIDTRVEKRDTHLKSADFLDVAKYPAITFKSKSAKKVGAQILVLGDLTIRGVTRPVTLTVTGLDTLRKNPWGQTVLAGNASTRINRRDFGLNWNKALEAGGVLVGDEVDVDLAIELNPETPPVPTN